MPRRWLVNTTNNRTVGVIDDDDAPVPAGRMAVAQAVIVASGTPRADIKTNGLWVVTNGVGAYTAPTPATTGETRDRRRIMLARNIIKNWLPAANGIAVHYRRCCEHTDRKFTLECASALHYSKRQR